MTPQPTGAVPSAAQIDGAGNLLQLIRQGDGATVSQMAAVLGVARSTIIQRLAHLEQQGFVRGDTQAVGGRGRPAAVIRFEPRVGIVLATQIGLTGYRAAVTDLVGRVLRDSFVEVGVDAGPDALLVSLFRTLDGLITDAGASPEDLAGVGIGTPSLLELRAFAQAQSDRHEWDLEDVRRRVADRFHAPVWLDLDVNMLALAEHRMNWPDAEVIVCLKLGTVIDASLVVRGEPVRGIHGLAGEFGHIKADGCEQPCTCGSRGCLDAVASGSALVRQLAEDGFSVEHVTDVLRLAQQGIPEAMHALRDAGRRIGAALAAVVNLLNPAAITAWGYLTESQVLFAGIREALYGGALPGSTQGLELTATSLGALAGVRGAAIRVIDEVLAPDAVDRMLRARSWSAAAVA